MLKFLKTLGASVVLTALVAGMDQADAATHSKKERVVTKKNVATKTAVAEKKQSKVSAGTAKATTKQGVSRSSKKVSAGSKSGRAQTNKVENEAPAANPCRVVVRKGRKTRICSVPSEPVLTSPIADNALTKPPADGKEPELKARTVPDRAYAVDGETFFFQGRKFRIAGLVDINAGSEMAKQRLQKALDSGTLLVDPISVDDQGVALASVLINGRNLADALSLP